jgi:hypothetical protein
VVSWLTQCSCKVGGCQGTSCSSMHGTIWLHL